MPDPGAEPARVALVTGGASGIGRATADRLAADGQRVFLVDRDGPGLDRALAELRDAGRPAGGLVADLSAVAECERAVAAAVAWGGRLDALVN
jgi:NAD(P)-dependent dehydrogenase (short-subunit alcohol dehydrogenase family)